MKNDVFEFYDLRWNVRRRKPRREAAMKVSIKGETEGTASTWDRWTRLTSRRRIQVIDSPFCSARRIQLGSNDFDGTRYYVN